MLENGMKISLSNYKHCMKKLLLILLCLPLLFGCGSQSSQESEENLSEYSFENTRRVEMGELSKVTENNKIRHYKGEPFNGEAYINYESGARKSTHNFMRGKLNGLFMSWYESGELLMQYNFKDNLQHGISKEYYENGQLKADLNYQNGKMNGLCLIFHENGELKSHVNFEDGEKITTIDYFQVGKDLMKKAEKEGVLQHYQDAITNFNVDLRINPNHHAAYINIAISKLAIGKNMIEPLGYYSGAETACTEAININPNSGYAYNLRGVARHLSNKEQGFNYSSEACKDLKKAIELGYTVKEDAIKEICL